MINFRNPPLPLTDISGRDFNRVNRVAQATQVFCTTLGQKARSFFVAACIGFDVTLRLLSKRQASQVGFAL